MRCKADHSMVGPTSLSTKRRTGAPTAGARLQATMPISPPMLVPTQSRVWGLRCASSASMSAA